MPPPPPTHLNYKQTAMPRVLDWIHYVRTIFFIADARAGAVRFCATGIRGIGLQTRRCHHRHRSLRWELVERRDRQ